MKCVFVLIMVHFLSLFETKYETLQTQLVEKIPVYDIKYYAQLIKARGRTICCAIHKLIISVWNKEELPEEWKESFVVPIYKKGDKTDCNNYRGMLLLPPMYKSLSNILLSGLIPCAEEVIGDHQCGFRHNRTTTDHIFCIHHILEKKWEYNEAVHQLFIDFKKTYDSVRR